MNVTFGRVAILLYSHTKLQDNSKHPKWGFPMVSPVLPDKPLNSTLNWVTIRGAWGFQKLYEPPQNSRCQKVPSWWFTNVTPIIQNVVTTVTWHPGFVCPPNIILVYILSNSLFTNHSTIQSEQMTALLSEIQTKLKNLQTAGHIAQTWKTIIICPVLV